MRTPLSPLFVLVSLNCAHAQWETLSDAPADLTFPVVVALDSTIHMMGGGGTQGATDLHLRYTPATDTWDTLAPVPYSAQQPCGAVVNGKIHFCGGGFPNSGTPLDHHHVYDPALDSWSPAADLPFPTVINEAVAFDGQLYVMSGQPQRDLCQRYDPLTDSWTANNDLPDNDFWYGAVVATGETIYRFGGGGYTVPVNVAMVYDPAGDSWSFLPDLANYRHAPAAAALGDSLIVISGGYWNGEVDEVWVYHVDAQTYTAAAPLPSARAYHSMVSIGGCVYAIGGNGTDPAIGVSLLRNCTLAGTVSINAHEAGAAVPYTLFRSHDRLTLHLSSTAKSAVDVQVLDASGKTVLARSANSGAGQIVLDGGALPAGVYLVSIRAGGARFTEEWVLTR